MLDEDQRANRRAHSRRARMAWRFFRVFSLVLAFCYVLLFILIVRTGYLSWFGILVGVAYVAPGFFSPIVGLAGRKRLEAFLGWLNIGAPLLLALAVSAALIWPDGDRDGAWRPYRFQEELAAIEAERAVPDPENAARRYESVFALMDIDDAPDFLFRGNSLREEFAKQPWRGEDHPQAAEWLDSHAKVIDELLAIGRMEQCRWPVQADRYDEYTVPYEKLRWSVQLLMAAGNRDLGEGRVAAALAKYFCTLRIADHRRQQPSMVDSMTGFSSERDALQMIRYVLVRSDLSDEDIAQIAGHLPPAADPWPQEWERLLEFEKLQYMNLLGRLYEVDDEGNTRFASRIVISARDEQEHRNPIRMPRVYWLLSMPRDPRAVRGIVDRHFATFADRVAAADLPQTCRAAPLLLNETVHMACNSYRWWAEMAFFNEDAYWGHRRWLVPGITVRRGTWLVLGLRRYRDAHGAWPTTLDAVSPYVPAEAFLDPAGDGAFVYAVEGDEFKLYGKGFNRIDEGGRHGYVRSLGRSEDDIAVWPPPVREPEPVDEEEMRRQMEEIFGRDFVEKHFRDE
jgi:hypothetical protein